MKTRLKQSQTVFSKKKWNLLSELNLLKNKNRLYSIIAIFFFLQGTHLNSCSIECDQDVIALQEKFYLNASQIHLEDNEIWIEVEDLIYCTPAVYYDEEGYYITTLSKKKSCSWYEWRCSKCHLCNVKALDWKCRQCGKSIEK